MLDNIHLFSRSLAALDARDALQLDVNTVYACLVGTAKHVCVSASEPNNVRAIVGMCATVAGNWVDFAIDWHRWKACWRIDAEFGT